MKTISLIITLLFLFSFGMGVLAQATELPSPGLTPDSKFYFLERMAESVRTFFTFGDLKKAERYAGLAEERLAEAKAVVEKGKPDLAEKTLKRYQEQLEKSIARAKKAESKGKDTEKVTAVVVRVGQATSKHLEVLAEVYEKVPEQAKPGVENAMKASVKGHQRAVEVLKSKNALGNVPEKVSLPEKVPQAVRERVQMRVQQELEIEETLQGLVESVESVRTFCIEQGAPPEMCEKIPLDGFASFKDFEDFVLELGATPEIYATLKAQCREVGATTANECFIVLSSVSVKTYQETSPTRVVSQVSPQRFESFEEFETDCLERNAAAGRPSEQCAALEAKCREAGAATADECYRGVDSAGNSIQPIEF